jgi:hypothetical protein
VMSARPPCKAVREAWLFSGETTLPPDRVLKYWKDVTDASGKFSPKKSNRGSLPIATASESKLSRVGPCAQLGWGPQQHRWVGGHSHGAHACVHGRGAICSTRLHAGHDCRTPGGTGTCSLWVIASTDHFRCTTRCATCEAGLCLQYYMRSSRRVPRPAPSERLWGRSW